MQVDTSWISRSVAANVVADDPGRLPRLKIKEIAMSILVGTILLGIAIALAVVGAGWIVWSGFVAVGGFVLLSAITADFG
jgi:hypothetical protein